MRTAILASALTASLLAGAAQAQSGWIAEFTLRYEAQASQVYDPKTITLGANDKLVTGRREARVAQEARGTLEFTQKVRGAVASRMPDANNEQRYDSWIFRPGSRGQRTYLSIEAHAQEDRAVRLGRADGEGADQVNAERKGKVGRIEHRRNRVELIAQGDDAGIVNGAFLQIDRVANKLLLETLAIDVDRDKTPPMVRSVARMDQPPAAGEWDKSAADANALARVPRFVLASAEPIAFDIPPGADGFTVRRDFEGKDLVHGGRATLTLVLRRR